MAAPSGSWRIDRRKKASSQISSPRPLQAHPPPRRPPLWTAVKPSPAPPPPEPPLEVVSGGGGCSTALVSSHPLSWLIRGTVWGRSVITSTVRRRTACSARPSTRHQITHTHKKKHEKKRHPPSPDRAESSSRLTNQQHTSYHTAPSVSSGQDPITSLQSTPRSSPKPWSKSSVPTCSDMSKGRATSRNLDSTKEPKTKAGWLPCADSAALPCSRLA